MMQSFIVFPIERDFALSKQFHRVRNSIEKTGQSPVHSKSLVKTLVL
jgi:hypothetical protein